MNTVVASPYPYPLPVRDSGDRVALVIIDMQRDFVEPGGFGAALGNKVEHLQKIVPTVAKLLKTFRELGLPVIHTREGHRPDLSDCPSAKKRRGHSTLRIGDPGPMGRILVLGEPGSDIVPELRPEAGELVIDKPGKGAFYATDLQERLTTLGITHLVFTGVTTEVCVQTSMREANDRGFECLLIEDGTESYFPEFKQATVRMIQSQGGIVGWVTSADRLIESLRQAYAGSAS
ncbi:cysteine hydrolase family protein [Candidatus Nitrospira nitrificans]|uniref:Putative isochorismatase n=1 Tax=Candidatus Nitrospira nitrificans TaxID=1742973 RepID=A0A0S4LIV8_9BACT|nr:isochorismatase family cysteine hydrolase [Candidatus Nitrospira nitrificans]CUS35867.1 putative isochorismatase [Candidatus Nitrospira nitrificans]